MLFFFSSDKKFDARAKPLIQILGMSRILKFGLEVCDGVAQEIKVLKVLYHTAVKTKHCFLSVHQF